MKLQYLADARDAFKWDLLQWVCTRSSPTFSSLFFVPLLTPPKKENEGRIPHHRFACREVIRPFVDSLKTEPRALERISTLGTAEPTRSFQVSVFAPERFIRAGVSRVDYWEGFDSGKLVNSVVFFDPDIGFETKTGNGPNWIRHSELKGFFARLPKTSVAVVYQHRPRRKWEEVFTELEQKIDYAHSATIAFEPNLAFVALSGNQATGQRVAAAITKYAEEHSIVRCHQLRRPDFP